MARNFRSKRGYYLENPPKLGDISRNTIFSGRLVLSALRSRPRPFDLPAIPSSYRLGSLLRCAPNSRSRNQDLNLDFEFSLSQCYRMLADHLRGKAHSRCPQATQSPKRQPVRFAERRIHRGPGTGRRGRHSSAQLRCSQPLACGRRRRFVGAETAKAGQL